LRLPGRIEVARVRSFWTNVTIVTATVTLVGGVISSVIALMSSSQQTENQREAEICKLAYSILGDQALNQSLTPGEARQFVATQLQLARKCAERFR
jgi:hypothetical protein